MRRRLLESLGVAAVMMALVLFLQLSAAGQAPAARGTGPRTPKTAWGHPDLQGIWLDEFDTPLERPAKYADKEFFTEEERTAQDEEVGQRRPQRARGVGSRQDVAGAYNAVFTSAKPTGRRTSLVVDPPNGRIPALDAAGPGAEPARPGVPPGPPSEHRHLQEQDGRPATAGSTGRPRRASTKCPRSTTRSA